MQKAKDLFARICEAAELQPNGSASVDPQITDPKRFYAAFAKDPFMGMGEAYVAGYFEVDDLRGMNYNLAHAGIQGKISESSLSSRQKMNLLRYYAKKRFFNFTNRRLAGDWKKRGQQRIAEDHYDLDNALMVATLGPSMKYTSAYWHDQYGAFDLDKGQELDLIIMAKRMGLKPGMKVLDVGFGFGVNTKYLVEHYGIEVTGLNISVEQMEYANKVCGHLSDKINFILKDWRDVYSSGKLKGQFDCVMHIEAIESIGGPKNFQAFFNFIADCLTPDGTCFGQVINTNEPVYATNPWIDKYIFPHGVLPKIGWMIDAMERAGFHTRLMDNTLGWANGRTCKAWWENFDRNWETLKGTPDEKLGITKGEKYMRHFKKRLPHQATEDSFYRIWKYYFLMASGGHEAGYMNDGHFIGEKNPTKCYKPDIVIPQTRHEVDQLIRENYAETSH